MGTPADQRLLELLDKWQSSLELHLRYASLDDDSYAKIQPWPAHQRPSRWIIELAMQRVASLRDQVDERIRTGDARFSESLEHLIFLANLVGARHIERSIPLAEAELERDPAQVTAETPDTSDTVSVEQPPPRPAPDPPPAAAETREMPKLRAAAAPGRTHARPRAAGEPAGVARSERKGTAAAKAAPKPSPKNGKPPAKSTAHAPSRREAVADAVREQVLADAERLLQWGRQWFELAELIARMADRPSLPDVRRILSDNKTALDAKTGRA
jgi:hypothetical protein